MVLFIFGYSQELPFKMKRITTKVGDVFEVQIDEAHKKYFQYVANDLTQLNSSVIRTFKTKYRNDQSFTLKEIVTDEIDFYAHVVLKWGIQLNLWKKIGSINEVGNVDVFFRDSNDYGNPEIKVSYDWRIWKINEPFQNIGKLEGVFQKAEIGVVVTATDIVERMTNGKYDFVYPSYE